MERHSRGRGKQKLLGSHQKCWIWGRNAVMETLQAGRWPIVDLYLSRQLPGDCLDQACALCAPAGLVPVIEDPEALARLCHTTEHQGYLARMTDFPYSDVVQTIAGLPSDPFCIVLDGIQDPYNFGAIVRSAEVFGANAVFIGEIGQVGVTSMVVRSSAGAINRIPIVRVADLDALIGRLRATGIRAVAASEKAEGVVAAYDFTRGTALLMGNEGVGPRPALLSQCDAVVKIPQIGRIGSLNVAVAAGIFCYEIRRQRDA
jgi:23S rRNA (guanosine2251-2'-O)-methyltransferase